MIDKLTLRIIEYEEFQIKKQCVVKYAFVSFVDLPSDLMCRKGTDEKV